MSVLIGSWEFEGPFSETHKLRAEPGIVAVLARNNNELELVEMDQSESVRDFVKNKVKVRFDSFLNHGFATAVYYCSDLNSTLRQGLVDKLMKEFDDESLECAS